MKWLPNLRKTPGNSCQLDYSNYEPMTVGTWSDLPQAKNIVGYTYGSS